MEITEFYTIETPPSSSSTSKDSTDELFLSKTKYKLTTTNIGQQSSHGFICSSSSKSPLTTNPITIKDDQVKFFYLIQIEYHERHIMTYVESIRIFL
jgi:hypothetical protein